MKVFISISDKDYCWVQNVVNRIKYLKLQIPTGSTWLLYDGGKLTSTSKQYAQNYSGEKILITSKTSWKVVEKYLR